MMTREVIYINDIRKKPGDFLFYMHQFVDAGKKFGFIALKSYPSPKHLFRKVMPLILFLINFFHLTILRRKILITTSRGDNILEASFPYYLSYQIIPMLWDTWPKEQEKLFKDLRNLRCPLVLVSSSQMAIQIEKETNIKTLWVPEGIAPDGFLKGLNLSQRTIDIYELGRQHSHYHKIIEHAITEGVVRTWRGNTYNEDGTLVKLAFDTEEELKQALSSSKVVICFPKIDTDPIASGNIETLTQRYWEVMLSRGLIVGRAPKELINYIGYNPVVEIDWNNPEKQLSDIIAQISCYQQLVDKNYDTALKMASWDSRIERINSFIVEYLHL